MVLNRNGFTYQLVLMCLIVSFASVSMILPAAKAKTDFTHNPDSQVTNSSETGQEFDRESDMKVVDQALSRKKVQEKLRSIGYTVDEIKQRLGRLDDAQIHSMAQRLEQVKAGGHLGLEDMNIVVLIVLVILAPILAIVWLAFMILGHDIHLHE